MVRVIRVAGLIVPFRAGWRLPGAFTTLGFATLVVLASLGYMVVKPVNFTSDSLALASVNTLTLGLLAGAGSAALALPLGYALARVPRGLAMPALIILCLPLAVPSYLNAWGWSRLIPGSIASEWNLLHALAVLLISYAPMAILVVAASTRHLAQAAREALLLHHPPGRALVRLELGMLVRPALIAGALVFVMTVSDFGIPSLFQVHVYATEIFVRVSSYQSPGAAVLMLLPMLLPAAYFVSLCQRSRVPAMAAGTIGGVLFTGSIQRINLMLVVFLVPLFLAPVIAWFSALEGVVHWWAGWRIAAPDLLFSLMIASVVSVCCLLVGFTLALLAQLRGGLWVFWVRLALWLCFVTPASLLGLGVLHASNDWAPGRALADSGMLLVLALTLRWLVLPFEVLQWMARRVPQAQRDAVRLLPEGHTVVMSQLLLHHMRHSVPGVGLLLFLFLFNELTLAVLLAPPGLSTLPMLLFSAVHYESAAQVATTAVWHLLILAIPVSLLYDQWRRQDVRT